MSRYVVRVVERDGVERYLMRGRLTDWQKNASHYPHPSNAWQAIDSILTKFSPHGRPHIDIIDTRDPAHVITERAHVNQSARIPPFTPEYIEATVERIPFSGCWIWMGVLSDKGYGRYRARGVAHRMIWEFYNGKISSGKVCRHSCENRVCVNPSHLFVVPKRDVFMKHGGFGSPEYNTWTGMRNRCQRPGDVAYKYYGARGISVCERWQSFENFYADMGKRPEGLSLDRIDNNGNYEPSNCRWATQQQQHENRRKLPKNV